jgi:hypothetical protein
VAQEVGGPIVAVPMPSDLKLTYQKYTQANLEQLNKVLEAQNL